MRVIFSFFFFLKKPCLSGTYQPSTSQSSVSACLECPSGQYNDQTSREACTPCSFGRYLGTQGGASEDDCILCIDGKYHVKTSQTSDAACETCLAGTKYHNTYSPCVSFFTSYDCFILRFID